MHLLCLQRWDTIVGYAAVFVYEQHEQADDTDGGVIGGTV